MRKQDFRRHPASRQIRRKVIIACEGSTERKYFEGLRKSLRLSTLEIIDVKPEGTDPYKIVQTAVNMRTSYQYDKRWLEDDCAWAVFDGEEHYKNNQDNWNDAIQLAKSKRVQLAVSDPCIELWLLLHFQPQTAYLNRDDACAMLKKHFNYVKGADFASDFFERIFDAIQNARLLEMFDYKSGNHRPVNPSTGIWELIELIHSLKGQ